MITNTEIPKRAAAFALICTQIGSCGAVAMPASADSGAVYTISAGKESTAAKKSKKSKKSSAAKPVADRYYRISKSSALYKKTYKGLRKAKKKIDKSFFAAAKPSKSNGNVLKKGQKQSLAEYVKLTSGVYKGYYIKISEAEKWKNKLYARRRIVIDYGKSMNGGRYSYGAARYCCTDCSGLVMQCYEQIGVNLSHSTWSQARAGKAVKLSKMQPGDVIVMNDCSHVALYVGNGKMVHALNSYEGIKIEPISKLKYYRVDTVRRIIK